MIQRTSLSIFNAIWLTGCQIVYYVVQCDAIKRVMRTNEICSIHYDPFLDNCGHSNGFARSSTQAFVRFILDLELSLVEDWNLLKIIVVLFLFKKSSNALRNRHLSELC